MGERRASERSTIRRTPCVVVVEGAATTFRSTNVPPADIPARGRELISGRRSRSVGARAQLVRQPQWPPNRQAEYHGTNSCNIVSFDVQTRRFRNRTHREWIQWTSPTLSIPQWFLKIVVMRINCKNSIF